MLPTIFGALVALVGIWCQFGSFHRTVVAMLAFTVFGAASAVDLPALGGASITPANFFLLFVLLRLVSMHEGAGALLSEMGPRRPLFLFLLLVLWILASAILLPRLFEGVTQVFSLSRTDTDVGTTPLRPTSGNLSQAVYAVGGFLVACSTCAFARKPGGAKALLTGLILVTSLDIGFAILDLVTAATHTGFILDVIHTAGYAFLTEDELGGLKRISGSFSEASGFAAFSLTLFTANFSLFVAGVRSRFTGPASACLAGFIVLSTSSAGYAGLGVFFVAFLAYALVMTLIAHRRRVAIIAGACVAGGALAVSLVVLLLPSVTTIAQGVITESLLNKATTDSAIERGSWNTQAWQVFIDTQGFGGGIGSTRASNYVLVLLSNLGLIGFGLFAILILRVTLSRLAPRLTDENVALVWAARVAVATTIVPMLFIGTIVDLGTLFYCLVGIAASGAAVPRDATASEGVGTFMRHPSSRPRAIPAK